MAAAVLLLSLLPLRGEPWAAGPAPIVLGTDYDRNTFAGKWYLRIYGEAFKRLDIPIEFVTFPTKRLSIEVDEGRVDGEAARVYGYAAAHPDLVRVEESVFDVVFSLYAANPALRLDRLEDLRAGSLLGEHRRGVALCENTLRQWLPADRLSNVETTEQGLKKLLAGRTDLYCELNFPVLMALLRPEFEGAREKVRRLLDLGKPMPLYPYLHQRNATLAPRLAATLKQMKAEGLIERYRIETEREFGWVR